MLEQAQKEEEVWSDSFLGFRRQAAAARREPVFGEVVRNVWRERL